MQDFSVEGPAKVCSPFFLGSEWNFTINQALKFRVIFKIYGLKLRKFRKIIEKIWAKCKLSECF